MNVTLTPMEFAATRVLCFEGANNVQIGKRLFIVEDTVKTHIKGALRKTGCGSRTELAVAVWSGRVTIERSDYPEDLLTSLKRMVAAQ